MVVPALLLGLAETGLRLAGYGYPTSFFKQTRLQDRDCLISNDKFGLRFFAPELARTPPPVIMSAKKEPGTFRVFVLGESAALGDPRPAFGVGRYLEVLLSERYPDAKFEVVCAAMTAINSHALLPIARECARHQGDFWVLYMGNNEMVGPFGPATVFGRQVPSLGSVRLGLAAKRTRLGQWLDALARRILGTEGRKGPWGGMGMFLEQQVGPDDPRRAVAHHNFAANLKGILGVAERAGCPVLLCTVASNLRDCAPFASLHSTACSTDSKAAMDSLVQTAVTNEAAGDLTAARTAWEQARQSDPGFAEVHFRLGTCLWKLGDRIGAAKAFEQARDLDALPFRADSVLNGHIRNLAAQYADRNVFFLDAEQALADQTGEKVPGSESFFEHVHLTFAGNYLLARSMAETIANHLPPSFPRPSFADWAAQEECEKRLGLTDWNRVEVIDMVLRRLQRPPFTLQINQPAQIEHWRTRINALRAGLSPDRRAEAREVYQKALMRRPRDHYLYENYAEFLEATGDVEGAVAQWQTVCSMLPHYFVPQVHAGRLLGRLQRYDTAELHLRKALQLEPRSPDAHLELGKVLAGRGQMESALAEYSEALQRQPGDARVHFQMADVLAKLGQRAQAAAALTKAIELQPSFWEARYLLGVELAMSNRIAEAQHQFEQTIRWRPNHSLAHLNLGVAYVLLGRFDDARAEFVETLRLDPQNAKAKQHLANIEAMTSRRPPLLP